MYIQNSLLEEQSDHWFPQQVIRCISPDHHAKGRFKLHLSLDMRFPTMWHFDKCRLRSAYAASF